MDTTKHCPICEVDLPLSNFYTDPKGRVSTYCKPCRSKVHRGWTEKNRDYVRSYYRQFNARHTNYMRDWQRQQRIKYPEKVAAKARRTKLRRFGVTAEWYEAKLKEQNGHCALCNRVLASVDGDELCIDHDHSCCSKFPHCGKCARGLLCHSCNQGLARLEHEGPVWAHRALAYLSRYASQAGLSC